MKNHCYLLGIFRNTWARTIILAAFLFLFQSHAQVSAQDEVDDDDVIAVDTSFVVLNAYITDGRGNFVRGLRIDQFRLLENGNEQKIDFFSAEETPFAAVILLDTSGSMGKNVTLARSAAIRFLDGLREEDSAAIYRFDSNVVQVQDFSNSRDVSERIFDLRSDGMTRLNDAIYLAAGRLADRHEKRRAIIVLSDGEDTFSGRSADRALRAAMDVGAVIYTVDMAELSMPADRRMRSQAALRRFAERSGGRFISTPGGAELAEAFENIVAELGSQYTIGFYPNEKQRTGRWRTLEVRVARPNLSIRTRRGYTAEKAK
jgi:Ca-activated chloride channel homolog